MPLKDLLRRKKSLKAPLEDSQDELPNLDADISEPPAEPTSLAEAMAQRAAATPRRQRKGKTRVAPQPEDETDDGLPSVNRKRGTSRTVNIIGFIVILAIGVGAIVWVNKPNPSQSKAAKKAQNGQADGAPPKIDFGAIAPTEPPAPAAATAVDNTPGKGSTAQGTTPISLANTPSGSAPASSSGTSSMRPGQNGAGVLWSDRKMMGSLLVEAKDASNDSSASPSTVKPSTGAGDSDAAALGGSPRSDLEQRLNVAVAKPSIAGIGSNPSFTISATRQFDCSLDGALDSTLPGKTSCTVTSDVFSDDGKVVLIDKGSVLEGDYQGGVKQGQARLFVAGTRLRTPRNVIINLNSPFTDSLGRSGVDGWVDNHWGARFGGALLVSIIKDGFAYAVASQQNSSAGNSTVIYGNTQQTSESLATKMLESTANIPPTLKKNHGDFIQIQVARDLDFSDVYSLRKVRR